MPLAAPLNAAQFAAAEQSKLDAYYGRFTSPEQKEVLGVPLRLVAAWAKNDADAVADVFTGDGILILPGDVFKRGRGEIRSFLAAAFAGPFRGTNVTGRPVDVRFVSDGVALIRTHGGLVAPGDMGIAPELAVRSIWVAVRDGGGWRLAGYQNSPRGDGATLRW